MAKDMNLTAQEIYEKEFHVDLKGYAPAEVDEFLDMVIEDYQKYDEKVEELGAAVTRYEEKIKELQQQLFALQSENENGSLTLAHSRNSQMSFMYGFFFVKFLFFAVVCVVIVI